MMQDLPRSPNELMPEVTNLIPYFIENLGNSKVSISFNISEELLLKIAASSSAF